MGLFLSLTKPRGLDDPAKVRQRMLPPNTNTLEVIGYGEGIYKGLEFRSFWNVETNEFRGFIIDHGR